MSEGRVEEVLTWLRQLEEDAGGWSSGGAWVSNHGVSLQG